MRRLFPGEFSGCIKRATCAASAARLISLSAYPREHSRGASRHHSLQRAYWETTLSGYELVVRRTQEQAWDVFSVGRELQRSLENTSNCVVVTHYARLSQGCSDTGEISNSVHKDVRV